MEVEKGHEQYTRERGGLPPCPFSDRLLKYFLRILIGNGLFSTIKNVIHK
jgi:hypothetical protein